MKVPKIKHLLTIIFMTLVPLSMARAEIPLCQWQGLKWVFTDGTPLLCNDHSPPTMIYGNFIEAIYIQQVPEGEQPLYARMLARSGSGIVAIARVDTITKYVINGKHVWARKFVRRIRANGTTSPPPESTSSPVESLDPYP